VARNLVNIEEVSKAFDIRALLERVSLGVSEGDRIGIVGRNGSGKSTLMKIIAAVEQPDQGRVTKANSVKIGLLSQVDKADPNSTVGDMVIGDKAKHEWARDSGIREVFTGLFGGFDDHLFERKFEQRNYWQGTVSSGALFYHQVSKTVSDKIGNLEDYGSIGTPSEQKIASEFLKEAGVKGIKYLDQGSRGTGEGTYNYVIFDPSVIQIVSKNGEFVMSSKKPENVEI
jgi:ABC-type oligopeptide transport system ATPase subunit